MPIRVCLLLAFLLLLTCAAYAETYDLRTQYQPGQTFMIRESQVLDLAIVKGDPPELIAGMQGQKFTSDQKSEVRCVIVKVADRMPELARTFLAKAQSLDAAPGEEAKLVVSPLAGKVVLVATHKDEKPVYTDAEGKPVDEKETEKWCRNFTRDLTLKMDMSAAEVGQEWTMPAETARRFFELTIRGEAGVKVKFVEVTERDGRKVAHMDFSGRISDFDEADPDTKRIFDIEGSAYLDLEKHIPYLFEGKGSIHVETAIKDKDKRLGTMVMEGPATMKTTYELVTR